MGASMYLDLKQICRGCNSSMNVQDLDQCSRCGPFCSRNCSDLDCRDIDCKQNQHFSCWEAHLPRGGRSIQLHSKIDFLHDVYMHAVINSESDPEKQQKLHRDDKSAQWFIVKLERGGATLSVSNRFRQLCSPGTAKNRWSSEQFPSLVSFIGDTGTGKSTLARAMMIMGEVNTSEVRQCLNQASRADQIHKLRELFEVGKHGPVTRTGNPEHLTDPTSSGVHLYKDPASSFRDYGSTAEISTHEYVPILFADCEGFRGGTVKTNSERETPREDDNIPNGSFQIPITSSAYADHGKEGAELFYAKFVYAFSDVVIFVTNEDQRLRGDLQRLLEWVAAAVYKSVNHLAHKTLIIVRNMALSHNNRFYDEIFLKDSLFQGMGNIWEESSYLKSFRDRFNNDIAYEPKQIKESSDYLKTFFADVHVCYIPLQANASSAELFGQYSKLRRHIETASKEGQEKRSRSWMRYNVPAMSQLFYRAFNHFATSADPFDFYNAARNDNVSPISMSDHIANLLQYLKRAGLDLKKLGIIPRILAACLVSYPLRTFEREVEPLEMFDKYLLPEWKDSLKKYEDRYVQCSFVLEKGSQCIVKGLAHGHHCDSKGNRYRGVFAPSKDEYDPQRMKSEIRNCFSEYYRKLIRLPDSSRIPLTRGLLLSKDYGSFWCATKSNKSCFACLQGVSDHVLPCGHGYCDQCIKEFGTPSEIYESAMILNQCVLCQTDLTDCPQEIRLKPKCAGVRVLTLDGGGVRGILELAILEQLLSRIGPALHVQDLFDLIVGTSTGGIIALGIAMTDHTVESMKEEFKRIARKTFKSGRAGLGDPYKITSSVFMLFRIWNSWYAPTPLRLGLQELFTEQLSMFSSSIQTRRQRATRVAVTAAVGFDATPCVIANYNRPIFNEGIDFEREDDETEEMRVWEAALATSAAPLYFPPHRKSPSHKSYVDGGLWANLPVQCALDEMARLWPDQEHKTTLDALISIGTGSQKNSHAFPEIFNFGSFKALCASFFNNLDSERTWQEYRRKPNYSEQVLHRLNAPLGGKSILLDDYKQMDLMENIVEKLAADEGSVLATDIRRVASILRASLFYFEPDEQDINYGHSHDSTSSSMIKELRGSIRCRLPRMSDELARLTDVISQFSYQEVVDRLHPPAPDKWSNIKIEGQYKVAVRRNSQFFRIPYTIRTALKSDRFVVIAAVFKEEGGKLSAPVPISGFPIPFKELCR